MHLGQKCTPDKVDLGQSLPGFWCGDSFPGKICPGKICPGKFCPGVIFARVNFLPGINFARL